jgi:prepilin-type N-terminal cleavage/methylation domain-containing protein
MRLEQQRQWRAARKRPNEQGLTLIELVISLAILALIVGFLAEGIVFARRAFGVDRRAQVNASADAGIDALTHLVGSAILPRSLQQARFSGHADRLDFVTLSEGYSLKGGPYLLRTAVQGTELTLDFSTLTPSHDPDHARAVAIRGVRALRFEYFGSLEATSPPGWHSDWVSAEALPDLVSMRLRLTEDSAERPPLVVAIRQH